MINKKIFKAYDIRGTYPDQINKEAIELIMKGYYTLLCRRTGKKKVNIALGCDMRISSPELHQTASEVLKNQGAIVYDLGQIATPTLYFSVNKFLLDGGVQISASHNPKEYNGVKMVQRDGNKLIKFGSKTGLGEILEIIEQGSYSKSDMQGEIIPKPDVVNLECQEALVEIGSPEISMKTVVSDPANSMGILPLTELFKHIPTKHIMINDFLDGTFPAHQADPLQHKTLRQLQDKVLAEQADIGICTDGDADRTMFINEKGEIIPATIITTLIAQEILRDNPGQKILVDIRYIKNVQKMVTKMGGTIGLTPVGHALITQQVNEEKAIFAGESSGHYYFLNTAGCESTVRVILYVLRVLGRENRPMSEIINSMMVSYESGESNFKLPESVTSQEVIKNICAKYSDGTLNEIDGIAISYDDWRFSIRSSNTEPLIRLNVEGDQIDKVKSEEKKLQDLIIGFGAHKEE